MFCPPEKKIEINIKGVFVKRAQTFLVEIDHSGSTRLVPKLVDIKNENHKKQGSIFLYLLIHLVNQIFRIGEKYLNIICKNKSR